MSHGHPAPETLTDFAVGTLKIGARLVVGEHLASCPDCREEVERLEMLAGALLAEAAPVAMDAHALDRAFAALERPYTPPRRLSVKSLAQGLWLPVGDQVAIRPLPKIADEGERVFFIRAGGGKALPEHGHSGCERLVVLAGAFEDREGVYRKGDFVERGAEHRHRPVACEGEPCVCLAATDGRLKMSGIARLMQPFLGV
jgi:putative transcriptional regulator